MGAATKIRRERVPPSVGVEEVDDPFERKDADYFRSYQFQVRRKTRRSGFVDEIGERSHPETKS